MYSPSQAAKTITDLQHKLHYRYKQHR